MAMIFGALAIVSIYNIKLHCCETGDEYRLWTFTLFLIGLSIAMHITEVSVSIIDVCDSKALNYFKIVMSPSCCCIC